MFRELVLPLLLSITDGLLVVAICGVLIAVEPMATIIVAGILMLTTVPFYRLFRKKAGSWGGLVQESEARKIRWLNEGLGSLKEIKVCGRESFFQDSFSRETNATARLQALYHTICAVPRNSMEIIIVSGMVLVILFYQVKGGVLTNAIPTLGLFTMAAFRILPSVSRLGHSFITMKYGAAAMNHIYEDIVLYRTRLKPNAKGEEQVNLLFERQIVLAGVAFQYPGSATRTLSNVNLSIKQGESVALIGPSGSGKTTLVDLILGILSPSDGCILVDERNIALNLRSWQSKVGYVPQTLYLCDDSLRRNIAFAIPEEEIDNCRVGEVIELACLKDLVESLPEGIETRVGERGVCLSGGQRQRIGIARALYSRPELLVLDEATSALDSNSEYQITMALERLKGRITIIVIAHRLTTVQWCDRLVFIKDGCIVDTGPYDELFTGSQDFRHFVQLQEFKGQV
jgi:ATP-binding cassette subfamily C protein